MAVSALAKKLRIQDGFRIALINAPQNYEAILGQLPPDVKVTDTLAEACDLAHLFVTSRTEVEQLASHAIQAVGDDGLLWFSYPKRSAKFETDITRDVGWDALDQAGWRPVTQISVDQVWSALRFRPKDKVGR